MFNYLKGNKQSDIFNYEIFLLLKNDNRGIKELKNKLNKKVMEI